MIDIVRAAAALDEQVSTRWVGLGYSQGANAKASLRMDQHRSAPGGWSQANLITGTSSDAEADHEPIEDPDH